MCYSRARLPLITSLTPQALECGRCARRSGAPRTRLRCSSILVDQSAEQILSAYGGRGSGLVDRRGAPAVWRDESERAVRSMLVVMAGVHAQYSSEMSASEDEDAIETVVTDRNVCPASRSAALRISLMRIGRSASLSTAITVSSRPPCLRRSTWYGRRACGRDKRLVELDKLCELRFTV
jgi:hypothetical protein